MATAPALVHEIAKRAAAQLSESLTRTQSSPTARSTRTCDEELAARLWRRLAAMYGHRWTSSYGIEDSGTWSAVLAGLTPEQVGRGLRRVADSGEEWPPSAPQFRALCLQSREQAAAYREHVALPMPRLPADRHEAHIAAARAALRSRAGGET